MRSRLSVLIVDSRWIFCRDSIRRWLLELRWLLMCWPSYFLLPIPFRIELFVEFGRWENLAIPFLLFWAKSGCSTIELRLSALALALPARQDRPDFGDLDSVFTTRAVKTFESSPRDSGRTVSICLAPLWSILARLRSPTSRLFSNTGFASHFLRLHLNVLLKVSSAILNEVKLLFS